MVVNVRRRRQQGFTLIELLIVIIVIGILAAIAVPMFLGQRDRAKEAAVKEGVHSIQVGLQTYAVDNKETYPTAVTSAGLAAYVDRWPRNPWTKAAMINSTTVQGNYSYTRTSTTTYTLVGRGKGARAILTVP